MKEKVPPPPALSQKPLKIKGTKGMSLVGVMIAAIGFSLNSWANEEEIRALENKIKVLKLKKELQKLKQNNANRTIAGSKDEVGVDQDQDINSNPQTATLKQQPSNSIPQTASLERAYFAVGILFIRSPTLKLGKGKLTGTIGNHMVDEELDLDPLKFDSALGIRIAAFYPLANKSWISLGGDLYEEASSKEGSAASISPKFLFANLGFGETISFFFGGGLGNIDYKFKKSREGISYNGQSEFAPFFQLGVNCRYNRFGFELFYRSIRNNLKDDIKGTIGSEGMRLALKLKAKAKTNMTSLAITALF